MNLTFLKATKEEIGLHLFPTVVEEAGVPGENHRPAAEKMSERKREEGERVGRPRELIVVFFV